MAEELMNTWKRILEIILHMHWLSEPEDFTLIELCVGCLLVESLCVAPPPLQTVVLTWWSLFRDSTYYIFSVLALILVRQTRGGEMKTIQSNAFKSSRLLVLYGYSAE